MQCGRCRSEMVPSIHSGLQLIWVCVSSGCLNGTMRRPRSYDHGQTLLDIKREQARTKIQRLLAVAASTNFPREAESARALATELTAKHRLSVQGSEAATVFCLSPAGSGRPARARSGPRWPCILNLRSIPFYIALLLKRITLSPSFTTNWSVS